MNDLLKKRMASTKQASELAASDEAYEQIFQMAPQRLAAEFAELPIDSLVPFFTADIGFRPYPQEKLKLFSEQLKEEGILERIIVRPIPGGNKYEILAGHNRTAAARLAGFTVVPAEIVVVDNDRAVVIATATNLLRRQELSIFERGKAYKALLDAKNRNGQRNVTGETFGEIRQRYNARKIVAEFFAVTEHEIRKAIKLTQLIPEIQYIMEEYPKRVNLACADQIADYDAETQQTFLLICQREDLKLDMAAMKYIARQCPPPSATHKAIVDAWNETQRKKTLRAMTPPRKISFDRKQFAPYIEKVGSDRELEKLFLEFLRQRLG